MNSALISVLTVIKSKLLNIKNHTCFHGTMLIVRFQHQKLQDKIHQMVSESSYIYGITLTARKTSCSQKIKKITCT